MPDLSVAVVCALVSNDCLNCLVYKSVTFASERLQMTLRYVSLLLSTLLFSPSLQAQQKWMLAAQVESIASGQAFYVDVIKPDHIPSWPEQLQLSLTATGTNEVVTLERAKKDDTSARQTYRGVSKVNFLGVIRAQLKEEASNRILMLAASTDDIAQLEIASNKTTDLEATSIGDKTTTTNQPVVVLAKPEDEPPLSANEPMYFLLGSNSERDIDSRFQLSFKYRPFDPGARVAQYLPALANLYFGYTQTTLWDIGADSSPFKDTSYRPSLYYKRLGSGRDIRPAEWRMGVEHESNGRDATDSRSINIAFVRPTWNFDLANGKRLSFLPKIYHYIEKTDNSDIHRYRGYVDWQVRYGREDGAILTGLYRQGSGGYASGQVDLSYPISDKLFGRNGTFIHFQLFDGYGETLIDYNRDKDLQFRLGLSLAR